MREQQIAANEDDVDETRSTVVRPVLARLGSLISSSSKIETHQPLEASLLLPPSYLTFLTAVPASLILDRSVSRPTTLVRLKEAVSGQALVVLLIRLGRNHSQELADDTSRLPSFSLYSPSWTWYQRHWYSRIQKWPVSMASNPPPKPSIDRYVVIHVATTCDEHGVYVTKDSAEVIEIGWILLDAKSCDEVSVPLNIGKRQKSHCATCCRCTGRASLSNP